MAESDSDGVAGGGESGQAQPYTYDGVHREGQTGRHAWNPTRTIMNQDRVPLGDLTNPKEN